MKQLTLVAFYQKKPKALIDFIKACQSIVSDLLPDNFAPYDHRQVHGTIIGLEGKACGSVVINRNLAGDKKLSQTMDLQGFLTYLRTQAPIPLTVQIGGFQVNDFPFESRHKTPYERTFSIQGNKLVAMGWPVLPTVSTDPFQPICLYPNTLDRIRRSAERFSIRHVYYQKPSDIDNDFYFRIGLFKQPEKISADEKTLLEHRVREYARTQPPLFVEIRLCDLAVVIYEDETLPLKTTQFFSLTDSRINNNFLMHCCDD